MFENSVTEVGEAETLKFRSILTELRSYWLGEDKSSLQELHAPADYPLANLPQLPAYKHTINAYKCTTMSEQCSAAPREQGWQQVCQQGTLFSHYNDVVTTLFNRQYCYNLLTRLSNNDNNSEQPCSINITSCCFNNCCCYNNAEQHC